MRLNSVGDPCKRRWQVYWLVPTVDAAVFQFSLAAFAEEQRAGKRKRILLVQDQAG